MLQDIRERIPLGVQIQTIEQTEDTTSAAAPTPAASPAPDAQAPNAQPTSAPSPTMKLAISGRARSFDEVNYFLLTLQRSSFLKSDETQLVKAELVQNPNKLEVTVPQNKTDSGATVTYTLPKTVAYQIQTSLSDIPASELLRELDRKGAVGLVTRIRTLQEKGVIQP
jgi:type IV pilus assembly protein PilN